MACVVTMFEGFSLGAVGPGQEGGGCPSCVQSSISSSSNGGIL